MPLTINSAKTATGTAGATGSGGAQGNSSQRHGGSGTPGQAGGQAWEFFASQSFQGDAGDDEITLARTAVGGTAAPAASAAMAPTPAGR